MTSKRYTDKDIIRYSAESTNMSQLLTKLGLQGGANYSTIRRKIKKLGLECKHWSSSWSKACRKNYLGNKFNRWVCIRSYSERCGGKGAYYILCECECGIIKYVRLGDLKFGKSKSCGCYESEMGKARWTGDKNPSWNTDLTDEDRLNKRNLEEFREWRTSIYERDNYTCRICGERGGTLNAHHLDGWHWCEERRYDVTNGVTLCELDHKLFHVECGKKHNTEEQFYGYCEKMGVIV